MSYEIDGKTAEQHREAAKQSYQSSSESWDRSDTDGFVTQWAGNMTARVHEAKAVICDNDGRSSYPALFDLDGNLVPAKYISTKYGMKWALLASDDPNSDFVGWFGESRAQSAVTRKRNDALKGYYVGQVAAKSNAKVEASGTGLSGAASAYVRTYRTDGGFSRDVVILDNGK